MPHFGLDVGQLLAALLAPALEQGNLSFQSLPFLGQEVAFQIG
jgi:hypothetical protein